MTAGDTRVFANDSSYAFIHVEGLDELIEWFGETNADIETEILDGMLEAAQPILTAARANARAIADDGTFAGSLFLKANKRGKVSLRSSDVAAGVKEFAKHGAVTRSSKGTPLANKRKLLRSGIGVPAGEPPRAMYKAINEKANEVANNIDAKLDEILRRA